MRLKFTRSPCPGQGQRVPGCGVRLPLCAPVYEVYNEDNPLQFGLVVDFVLEAIVKYDETALHPRPRLVADSNSSGGRHFDPKMDSHLQRRESRRKPRLRRRQRQQQQGKERHW